MNAERWRRVRGILDEALSLPSIDRAGFVASACSNDADLRAEIESLLRSHDDAGSLFLNTPAVNLKEAMPSAAVQSRIGTRIGVYQLVGEIGHGGMGEVYRANRVDGQFDKQVAIKLVRGGMDVPTMLQRFRSERQILASLDHPNIARLYDGGTTSDGIPYLVMELVEGIPIDQHCEKDSLTVPLMLHLFLQVCSAVQYAHQHLVIHRDIKPNNILVTSEGVPKLLDFGIAKILGPSLGAETTLLRPMTPEYASPEQIRGETITTATDVYSLGVVLYKLLTGRSPYPTATGTPMEFAKAICEIEPLRPSTVLVSGVKTESANGANSGKGIDGKATFAKTRHVLKGDLDNIILKSLRKESARRYLSVEQMAEDIRRHLGGLPVTATPDSLPYRIRKFALRNKTGVAATGIILVAIAAGGAATLREARIAVQERARAERRFNDVRKLANSFLFEFDEAIKNLPGSTPARSLVVKRALEYLDGLAAEARDDHSLQLEIASAYKRVGEVQGDPVFPNLGDSNGALQSSNKALAILEALSRVEPANQQVRLVLATTHQQVSDVLNFSGDTAGAVEHSGKALKLYQDLSADLAHDANFQTQLVTQTYHHANLVKAVGGLDEAAAEYRKAAELSKAMIAANPSNPEGKIHLATSLDGLGNVLQELGDTAGALENRRRGLDIREELAKLDVTNAHYQRQIAFSHHNVGLSLVEAGDLPAALANFREELRLFESLSDADPKDVQGRRNRSLAHKQIGDVLMTSGDVRGALAQYRSALNIDRTLASVDPGNSQATLDLSFSEGKFGSALGKLGQAQEASTNLRSGVIRQEKLIANDPKHILLHNHLSNSYTLLANFLLDRRETQEAITYYRKAVNSRVALAQRSPNSNANRAALAECYANLARALGSRDADDSLKQYTVAIDLLERVTSVDRANIRYRIVLADALANTARLYMNRAEQVQQPLRRHPDWAKARSLYVRSRDLWLQLSSEGKLPAARALAIRRVNSELAQCDASMAKLEQAPRSSPN